uniref:Uncharacterized protein n=1 Tax=Ciona savignyi TaxID=51511 RepID=H2Y8B3_CIOSA
MSVKSGSSNSRSSQMSHLEGKLAGIQLRDFEIKRDVLKIAISFPDSPPRLYEINQKTSLKNNISEFCKAWSIPDPHDYALQVSDSQLYITEENRHEVRDGSLLNLTTAPWKAAESLMRQIRKPETAEGKVAALMKISKLSADPTFSEEFIRHKGVEWIVSSVEKGTLQV